MAKTTDKPCENCGTIHTVRTAHLKRGWGRFCSRSCKAKEQTRRTGNNGPRDVYKESVEWVLDDLYPDEWDMYKDW